MVIFFILGMLVLKSQLQGISSDWWIAGLLGMVWMPMMHTIIGGQNAALVFCLLSCAYVANARNQEVVAGLALGLLLFKPQYAVPLLGLLLLRKKWKIFAVALPVGIGQYILGAFFCGWDWPLKMVDSMSSLYRAQERIAGGSTHISIMEVIDFSIIQPLEKIKADPAIVGSFVYFGYGIMGSVVALLIYIWRRVETQKDNLGLYWASAISGTLLISLHTQYYDISLLVLPFLLILNFRMMKGDCPGNWQRLILLGLFLVYPAYKLSNYIQFQPLIMLPIYVLAWSIWDLAYGKDSSRTLKLAGKKGLFS
jgi:hypothetical protein